LLNAGPLRETRRKTPRLNEPKEADATLYAKKALSKKEKFKEELQRNLLPVQKEALQQEPTQEMPGYVQIRKINAKFTNWIKITPGTEQIKITQAVKNTGTAGMHLTMFTTGNTPKIIMLITIIIIITTGIINGKGTAGI